MSSKSISGSYIFSGKVNHKRFSQRFHSFTYPLYMLALDIDDLEQKSLNKLTLFGSQWFKPVRFKESDYLKGDPILLRDRINRKLTELGADEQPDKVIMLVQCRCFGLYFSPANFYFCYNQAGACTQMLAEVSNTPWNQRYYYLIDMRNIEPSEKSFHVSPFMDLDMKYHWQIKPPNANSEALSVRIENKREDGEVAFEATLALKKLLLSNRNMKKVWLKQPMMTLSVVKGIYIQALKLFAKKIKFVPYQTKHENSTLR